MSCILRVAKEAWRQKNQTKSTSDYFRSMACTCHQGAYTSKHVGIAGRGKQEEQPSLEPSIAILDCREGTQTRSATLASRNHVQVYRAPKISNIESPSSTTETDRQAHNNYNNNNNEHMSASVTHHCCS